MIYESPVECVMAKLLTRKELATKIGKTPNTIYRYEVEGKAPVKPIKLRHNGQIRYPEDAPEKYLAWMNEIETVA